MTLDEHVLADGHHPADGLASLDVPATVEVVLENDRHIVDVTTMKRGAVPNEWVSLRGEARDGRLWAAELDRPGDGEHYHAGYILDTMPVEVACVRRLVCDDCGSSNDVQTTETDGMHRRLCGRCRDKWGTFLTATYGGDRR